MKRNDWGFLLLAVVAGLIMLLSSIHARADDWWLTTGVWSYHADRESKYRENNSGFGFEYEVTQDTSVLLGAYINSVNRHTNYIGYAVQPVHIGAIKLGLAPTLATGYHTSSGYVVVPVPLLTYNGKSSGINLILVPNVIAAVQFKWRL